MVFRAPTMSCLACRVPMELAETVAGHELELCGRCGAAWMDVAEFLAELREAQPRLALDELLEHDDGPCPRCGERMAIVWLDFLRLEQCGPHGIWFDGGELDRALAGDVVPAEVAPVLEEARRRGPTVVKKP
jgi:Zn-finger nucleic acid-binding protein